MNPLSELAGMAQVEKAYDRQSTRGLGQQLTYTERVLQACNEAEQRANDLKRVKEILDKNPEIEELLTILGRVHV